MSELTVRVVPVRPEAITVATFNRTVKTTLESQFSAVWVEGEITGCKLAASGHAYFDLKDEREDARVACCLFKGQLSRVRAAIRDGERVQVRARASLYPARGSFQLIVDAVMPAGAGSAAAALEALKRKLAAEGLFAPERKRALPRFPRAIGVVTSQHGAAFADICRVVHRRWPVRIVIAPTLVQGADAPGRIVAAIMAIQRVAMVDVVIIGRGGGSSDDLSAFNDERVARAIAASRVPIVSAVGHEIDHTLADLAADVRASTPSNAAELCVPEWVAVRAELAGYESRLGSAARGRINARRVKVTRWEKRLGDPRRFTQEAGQRLDEALVRMAAVLRRRVSAGRRAFEEVSGRLNRAHPSTRLTRSRGQLASLTQRLGPAAKRVLEARERMLAEASARLAPAARGSVTSRRAALEALAGRLHALSPLAILSRGYSVTLAAGVAVTDAGSVKPGDTIAIRLHRGVLDARVVGTRDES